MASETQSEVASNTLSNKASNKLDDVRRVSREAPSNDSVIVSHPEIVEQVVKDPNFLAWMKQRYASRGHAIYMFTSARYLLKVLEDPLLLRRLNYRRARGVLEAIPAIRDYAAIMYGVELNFNTKLLRRFMPPKSVEEVTESILEFELKSDGEAKDIVEQAVEAIKKVIARNTKYKLPCLIAFFTGLRSTEIKYILDNWSSRRKIPLRRNTCLVVVNYDRGKKKSYITIMPQKLVALINENHPIILTANWKDHVRHKLGINLGLFRKAWIAITSNYLDEGERDLLQGRLRKVQVEHYIKHILQISEKYANAFMPYLCLLESLAEKSENP